MAIGSSNPSRPRGRAPGGPAASGTAALGGSWMKRGDDARQRAEAEIARQREVAARREGPRVPWRFWVPVGQQREIVVLDTQIGPSFYEHQLQNPKTGKWDSYEPCPKEWEPCPICMADAEKGGGWGKDSAYLMFLTVAELTPWTDKEGREHAYSIRLLAVKAQHHGFFVRQFDRHGTLRGMHLLMSRDTKNTPNHGTPEFVEMHSEEDIIGTFGHEAVVVEGKTVKPTNADCFPVDYDRIFKEPNAADIRLRHGLGGAPAGSRAARRDEWGDGEEAGARRPSGGIGRAAAGGSGAAVADADDEIPY